MNQPNRPYFIRLIAEAFAEITDGDNYNEWIEATEKMDYDLPSMESPVDLPDEDRAYWIAEEAVNHWMIDEDECFFEEQARKQEELESDIYWEGRISQRIEEGI